MNRRIYLDYAATTPMHSEAVDAMSAVLRDDFGNPSGVHREAQRARALLDDARDRFAAVVGANPHEVVFTGGGTEAINLALSGTEPASIAWSAIEHDAVRSSAAAFERAGMPCVSLPVNETGVVDCDRAAALLTDRRPSVVAVMAVNNEVGTIQPIADIAALCAASGSLLVVDAVQGLSWLDLRPIVEIADFVAISGHKFGGPKGVGALIVRGGRKIRPLLHGGGQEQERRSGTQNVAGIVGMAVAAEVTDRRRADDIRSVGALRDAFVDELVHTIDGCTETVSSRHKVAGNAHVCITGVESEELLVMIDREGVAASAGSACASGALHLSPVLLAMGIPVERARGSMRFTIGPGVCADDLAAAAAIVRASVERLRSSVDRSRGTR